MSSEKKSFSCGEQPLPRQFAPVETYSTKYIFHELERQKEAWQQSMTSRGRSLDQKLHESLASQAVVTKCKQGVVLLTLQEMQRRGTPLPKLAPEIIADIPHARKFALGAYASSLLFDTIFSKVRNVFVTNITKQRSNMVFDAPNFGNAGGLWAVHVGREVLDAHFEDSAAPRQWYKDEAGQLLVERVITAEPTDAIRSFMEATRMPQNFDQLVTLYPHVTANAVLDT